MTAQERTTSYLVRLTPHEREVLEHAAELEGGDIAGYCRRAIRRAAIDTYKQYNEEHPFDKGKKKNKADKRKNEAGK